MVKTEFMYLMEELDSLTEEYVLEAHGYKVGDLVEIDSFGNYTSPLHGMVLDCFDGNSKIIGVMLLVGNCPVSDTPLNEIHKKISEEALTEEEKSNYDKHGKSSRDKKFKELSGSTYSGSSEYESAETDDYEARDAVDHGFLRDAIQLFQNDEEAEGVVVSCQKTPKSYPIRVCRLYYSQDELQNIIKHLHEKHGDLSYIHAYHDRGVIELYKDKWKKADTEAQKQAQQEVKTLFNKKVTEKLREVKLYSKCFESEATEAEYNDIYREYVPKNIPADSEEQDRILRTFVKALEQHFILTAADTGEQAKPIEARNAKLNRARKNNSKIVKAFKEVGLATDDLTVTAKNKKGKDYKKASAKLNKLRKTLFGEAFDEELDDAFNQDF